MKRVLLKMKRVLLILKNSVLAILKGEFLLRLNAGKYYVHIIFVFLALGLAVWLNLAIDNALHQVEVGYSRIDDLKMINAQKRFETELLDSRAGTQKRLREMGSELAEPTTPATEIPGRAPLARNDYKR